MKQYLVGMLPQSNLLAGHEHFVASGRQVRPLTGAADLEPGDLVGVAHVPLLRVPLKGLQHAYQAADDHPERTAAPQAPAAMRSPAPVEAATAVTFPSPELLERFLNPDQRFSFLRAWARLPPHLREVAFDLHDLRWTPTAIEQSG